MSYKWSAELFVSDTKPRTPTTPTSPNPPTFQTGQTPEQASNQATDALTHNLQVERQNFQQKLYTKWLNSKLIKAPGSPQIEDLFLDLRDGRNLLLLLQVLTGRKLKPVKGNLRLHHLNNLTLALDVLKEHKVKLIGIHNDSITDGDTKTTLGLCWNIMYHFQVVETMEQHGGNAEEALLKWCESIVADYSNASVKSFKPKQWRKGYTLNALLHAYKPDLFRYSDLTKMNSVGRIEHALYYAQKNFGVYALFTAEEFHNDSVDSKALVLYVSSLYEQMKDLESPGANKAEADLSSKLKNAETKLLALNEKEVPELYLLQENKLVMENLHKDVMLELDMIAGQLSNILQELDAHPKLKEEEKDRLQEKLSELVQLHADVKDKWDTCKESFYVKLDQQEAKETLLLSKWKQKSKTVDEHLIVFEGKLNAMKSEPITATNAARRLADCESLTAELETKDPLIQSDIEFGRTLIRSNKITSKPAKDGIQSDIGEFVQRRSHLVALLVEENKRLTAVSEEQENIANKKLKAWLEQASLSRKTLRGFEVAGQTRSTKPQPDIQNDIAEQQKLLEEAKQYKGAVNKLVMDGNVLRDGLSSETKKEDLQQEMTSINDLSLSTIEFLEGLLRRLRQKYEDQVAKELILLNKWREKADVLTNWLDDMEDYLDNLNSSNDRESIVAAKKEFEVYHQRLQIEEKGMQSNIDYGSSLLRSGKIFNTDNRGQLQTEVDAFSLRKDQLSKQMLDGNTRFLAVEEQYATNQVQLLNLWFAKANELKKQLREYELKGQFANAQSKEEIQDIVRQLKELLANVHELEPLTNGHLDEGSSLLTTTPSGTKADELDQEIKGLKTFSRVVVESLESNLARFQNRLNEIVGDEEQLLLQWKEKRQQVDEWLCQIENEVDQFAALPEEIFLLETAVEDHEVFSSNVANKEGDMEISVGFGNSLLHSARITDQSSKAELEKDLNDYALRKEQVNAKIKDRKANLLSALESERKKKSSELNGWLVKSAELKKQLREYEQKGQFANAQTKEEIQEIVTQIKELLNNVQELQPSIDGHLDEGDNLSKATTNGAKADELNQEIQALRTSSKLVTESLESSLLRFQNRLNEIAGDEEQLLLQWKEKRQQVDVMLCQIEEKVDQFAAVPEEISLLEVAMEEHEVFSSNVANKEGDMEISVGFGNSLFNSARITDQSSKAELEKDLNDYAVRKEQVNAKIKDRKANLLSALDNQRKRESSDLNAWLEKASELKSNIRTIQSEGREINVNTVEDLESAIAKQQALLRQAEESKPNIDKHASNGGRLMKAISNPTKIEDLKEEIRSLLVLYKSVTDSLKDVLRSYNHSLGNMSKEKDDNTNNLMIRLQLFHDWIQFAKQQLQFVSTSKYKGFDDLIQKEQGLKKLSADMETRADEFDQFMKMLQALSGGQEGLSGKDRQTLEKIEELQGEWNFVIDTVDQEFKSLYDAINSLVDEKRGMLEKSLAMLKKQLDRLEQYEQTNESMLQTAKHLSQVSEELSKVKPLIAKLSQQTGALSEVSLFMDNEKEVMKQSSEELQLQYVECRDQAADIKSRMQKDIIGHITVQCDSSSKNTKEIEQNSAPFDSVDLNSLSSVKEFLYHEQKIVEEIKVEHFKVDDIEHFAEQISGHNIVSPDDQVELANAINSSLKTIEDAQKKSKAKINKVYAVCYHTLNQNFQLLMARLQEIEKESSELDDSVIKDFSQLKNDMSSMKALRRDLDKVDTEQKQIGKNIEEIKGLLDPSDEKQLVTLESSYHQAYNISDEHLTKARERLISKAGAISERKLDEFLGWYPIMKRRSEEGSEIGPDAIAIERQLQEVKVIEQQANQHSFNLLFDDEDGQTLLKQLETGQQSEIEAAHADWLPIREWLVQRKRELENARNLWEEFVNNSTDLVDYMKQTEREVHTWNKLDLNDEESVEDQKILLKELLKSMETRKPHTLKLTEVTEELLHLIGGDSQVANKVRSQVADIFDMWNSLIKSNIENSSKLAKVHKKFKELDRMINELRQWITSTVEILRVLSTDDGAIEDSMKKVESKRLEYDENKENLDYIVHVSEELSSDADTVGHFTINEDIPLLERDFQGVSTQLDRLDGILSKASLFARRIRHTIRRKIDGFNSPASEKSAVSNSSGVPTEETPSDIQLQDVVPNGTPVQDIPPREVQVN